MGSVELAILKVAQEGGYLEAIPEEEDDIKAEAQFYIKSANDAYEDGMKKDKTILAIRNLAEQLANDEVEDIFGAPEAQLFRGLPVPEDLHGEPSALPLDFTELSPKQIRKLHAEYNAYAARARWMLAIATNKLAGVVHLREAEYRRAYRQEYEANIEKKLTRDLLDFAAKNDKYYKDLDEVARLVQEDVTAYKALTEIYGDNVDRLSREWTMRQDEDKRY